MGEADLESCELEPWRGDCKPELVCKLGDSKPELRRGCFPLGMTDCTVFLVFP